jgi:26S proteasome regulatory subunit N5
VAIRLLTEIYLKRGQMEDATKLIQDIQIETFGSLERAYKVDYILFQMRILLQKGDYVRTLIVSNKVARKHLNEDKLEKLKLEFYQLMIKYNLHEERFLEVSKCYKTLFDFVKELELKLTNSTQLTKETVDNYTLVLKSVNRGELFVNYVTYLSLCPPELETKNMFNELNLHYKKDLEESSDMNLIVRKKLSDDIVYIDDRFLGQFKSYPAFVKSELVQEPEKHFSLFRKYFIQHNIVIFEKFFTQIRLERIAQMVGINKNEVESEIADMVINKYVYAKMNRIQHLVSFKPKQEANDKLDDLNFDLAKMLEKIETTCHLIHKENLKYDIK